MKRSRAVSLVLAALPLAGCGRALTQLADTRALSAGASVASALGSSPLVVDTRLGGSASLAVRWKLATKASDQALVHRLVVGDVVEYDVSLASRGQNLATVPVMVKSGESAVVFDHLRLNVPYNISVIARGNPGGDPAAPLAILDTQSPSTGSVEFSGSNDVEDQQSLTLAVQLDTVLFAGTAATALAPVSGGFGAPAMPETGFPAGLPGFLVSTFATGSLAGPSTDSVAPASFSDPAGLAVDSQGKVYLADAGDARIDEIAPGGAVTVLAGSTPGFADGPGAQALFDSPEGVAADGRGNILVADTGNCLIREIDPAGNVSTIAGSGCGFADGPATASQFDSPFAVLPLSNGTILVTDSGNNRIRQIAPDGTVSTLAGSGTAGLQDGAGSAAEFDDPAGMALAPDGQSVIVADSQNDVIRRVTLAGGVTTLAGDGHFGDDDGALLDARFDGPLAVAVDPSGTVYVADTNNNTVREIAGGFVTTLAGSGWQGYVDGPANSAEFDNPAGLAYLPGQGLLVSDTGNGTIRLIQQNADE